MKSTNTNRFLIRKLALSLFTMTLVLFFQNCGPALEAPVETASSTDPSNDESDLPEVPETPETPEPPTAPQCLTGTHLENTACVSNYRSCPITNGTAQQIWNGTSYGTCTIISCNTNYSNQSNTCVFSPSSCPIANGNGETQTNDSCRLVSCSVGFHANGNVCDSNNRSCPITNGAGQQTWNGTSYNACQVVSCSTNFHINGNTCRSNSQLCAITNGAGQQIWNGTAFGTCTVTACNPGYGISGNTCTSTPVNPTTWGPKSSARVFISGHSLTDDPLAGYFVDIATKRGDSIAYNQQIVLGSPIRVRTRGMSPTGWSGYTLGKNRDGGSGLNIVSELQNPQTIGSSQRYDTLVLTENHNLLDMIQWEDTIKHVRHYHDRLVTGNATAKTLLYNSWLDIDKSSPANWIDHEKKATLAWECVSSKVNLSLQSIGRNDRVLNMPTGAALVRLVERIIANQVPGITGTTSQKLNLIFSDNVHLTPLGVYYVALVTYSSVYGKAPTGITPPSGISANTATEMQNIAWNFINSYYSTTNPGTRDMSECRAQVTAQVCPSYWTLKGSTGNISGCQSFYNNSSSSPFRWPDSSFTPFPAP